MTKKIRLYRGPFNGKVMEHPSAGANEITIRGPKPMTRKQRYEWEREWYMNGPFDYIMNAQGQFKSNSLRAFPQVTANYKICIGPGHFPLRHPDGSIFYEWDQSVVR